MSDELLNYLGNYFVNRDIRLTLGITFEQFLQHYKVGTWRDIIKLKLKGE
ncbi:hypothetical protein [Paenibacillus sp. L3-i20]|nr:hypothetical protein [Paenibacillus sp. L3-i20]GKU79820.1 hypothetical protein L3i20_v242170 [Paenibacillus sp. L3-i20]